MPSIDDREDMQFANEAFDILGFSEEMKYNVSNVQEMISTLDIFLARCSKTLPP